MPLPAGWSTAGGMSTACVACPPMRSSSDVSAIACSLALVRCADPERLERDLLEDELVLWHVVAPAVQLHAVHRHGRRVAGERLVLEAEAEVERRADERAGRPCPAGSVAEHQLEQRAVH